MKNGWFGITEINTQTIFTPTKEYVQINSYISKCVIVC